MDPRAPSRPQRRRPAVPPLLRVRQPGVRSGAKPLERHQARRQLRGGLHPGRRPCRHRERPQPRPVLHRGPVHDSPDHGRVLAQRARRPRQRHHLRLRPQPGLHVPARPGGPGLLLPVDRRQDVTADPGRDRGSLRGHRRGPPGPRRPGQRRPGGRRRAGLRLSRGRPVRHGADRHASQGDEGARRRPRAGHRVGRPVTDLPRPHPRGRGLDDRLVARSARQRGATGLGGERRDRFLLTQWRRIAGHLQGFRPPVRVCPVGDAPGERWRPRAGPRRGNLR